MSNLPSLVLSLRDLASLWKKKVKPDWDQTDPVEMFLDVAVLNHLWKFVVP